eukprot:g26503.t1
MSTTLVKRLPPWRCEVTGCDSVNFFTQSKCRACNALCPLFMAQPDPRNWAVSAVLAIHGAFENSVDLLHIAEKGIGGTLSMTVVLSAVNAEELVVSVKQLDTWTDKKHKLKALRPARSEAGRKYGLLDELVYSEQLDLGQSHLLILARTYFQDFVWSGRKEAQPGRGRCQQQVEKEGEGKSKEASVKRGRKKHSFDIVPVSNNSGENETEAGNAPSAMANHYKYGIPSLTFCSDDHYKKLVIHH